MKNLITERTVISGGVEGSHAFGISAADETAIIGILRDTIYSDKILAVLREYGSNAWDEHRTAGKADLPIEVTLPTEDAPLLRIRDHGPGLSQNDIFTVYTQYGRSTKRASNDAVGMLGIGSKSGFAYSDSFTVTSWHPDQIIGVPGEDFVGPRCGFKSIYIAALDSTDRGLINLVHQEACDPADTGIEVQIAVQPDDIHEFETKARNLYRHFNPRPIINIDLPELPSDRTTLASGTIDYANPDSCDAGTWVAVMGCVPYRIRLAELNLPPEHSCLRKLAGTLTFSIGDVQIAANREELRYTPFTKAALTARFTSLVDEYVSHTLKLLDDVSVTPFDKRKRLLVLAALDLPLPDEYEALTKSWVNLFDGDSPLTLVRNGSATNQVQIDGSLRLLIDDTGKKLSGYRFEHYDYVVRSTTKRTLEETRALLDEHLAANLLTGVTVDLLSTQPWQKPIPKSGYKDPKQVAKHKAKMFVLTNARYRRPYSDNWEAETREALADDVYVVLENFEAIGYSHFYQDVREDKEIAEAFGVELPAIYGYKSTEKKPVDKAKLLGTNYRAWRETWIKSLLTPERVKQIGQLWWCQASNPRKKDFPNIIKKLGKRHPIVQIFTKQNQAYKKLPLKNLSALQRLAIRNDITRVNSEANLFEEATLERYPPAQATGD